MVKGLSKVVSPIIADGKIVDIDKPGEIEHKGTIEVQLNLAELQQRKAGLWDLIISVDRGVC